MPVRVDWDIEDRNLILVSIEGERTWPDLEAAVNTFSKIYRFARQWVLRFMTSLDDARSYLARQRMRRRAS